MRRAVAEYSLPEKAGALIVGPVAEGEEALVAFRPGECAPASERNDPWAERHLIAVAIQELGITTALGPVHQREDFREDAAVGSLVNIFPELEATLPSSLVGRFEGDHRTVPEGPPQNLCLSFEVTESFLSRTVFIQKAHSLGSVWELP